MILGDDCAGEGWLKGEFAALFSLQFCSFTVNLLYL